MSTMKRVGVMATIFLLMGQVWAGGYTKLASIESVEIIRGQGFEVRGKFGNPANCSSPDTIFFPKVHPQYEQLLSVVMTAFVSGKRIQAYIHSCVEYGWHGGTFNQLDGAGALIVRA